MENTHYIGVTKYLLTCIGYEVLPGERYVVDVRCACGTVKRISTTKFGITKSCGCLQHQPKHGMARTSLYKRWQGIKERCGNPNHSAYAHYGGRGIRCHWVTFEDFYRDMGEPPTSKHSIERVDGNGDYCKENCIWTDHTAQMNNTRHNTFLEWEGERQTIAQWARHFGVKHNAIASRLRRGWSIERIFKRISHGEIKNEDREPKTAGEN